MSEWAIAASWSGAIVAVLAAVAAWRSARSAEASLAIERDRRHDERAPQLRGEFHPDFDGDSVSIHHDSGAVPDHVDLRVSHCPPRCAEGFHEPDPMRVVFALTRGGQRLLQLRPAEGQDAHIGGTLVLDGIAREQDSEWPIAVRVAIPHGRTGRARFF